LIPGTLNDVVRSNDGSGFSNFRKATVNNTNGFTLAEVIITVVILGILAALAIPNLSASIERTRSGEGVQILNSLLSAQRIYFFENGSYAAALSSLDVEIPAPANFAAPTVANNANQVATIVRTGSYRLCVNTLGTLSCANLSGTLCATINIPAPVNPATCN
jgi:prepilin-type N-terminal cleavage/methylation domain-containing protein